MLMDLLHCKIEPNTVELIEIPMMASDGSAKRLGDSKPTGGHTVVYFVPVI